MELKTYALSDEFCLTPDVIGVFCFFEDEWPVLLVLKQDVSEYEFVDVDR